MSPKDISDGWLSPSGKKSIPSPFLLSISPPRLCLALTRLPTLTHTGWCRDIPLGQCPRYREALDLWGPLQGIARVAFEANDGPHGEVTAKPLAVARFWHRTALCGAGSGYRCGEEGHSGARSHRCRNWLSQGCMQDKAGGGSGGSGHILRPAWTLSRVGTMLRHTAGLNVGHSFWDSWLVRAPGTRL